MLCYPWGYIRFYNSKYRRLVNQIDGRSRVMLELMIFGGEIICSVDLMMDNLLNNIPNFFLLCDLFSEFFDSILWIAKGEFIICAVVLKRDYGLNSKRNQYQVSISWC